MGVRGVLAAAAACFLPAASPAFAHSGFLYAVLDDADGSGEVILEASFSDTFPEMDIALRSDDWTIITPSGQYEAFDRTASTTKRTVLRAYLDAGGTYRLSSGERLGRTGEVALVDGEFARLGGDGAAKDQLPSDAQVLTSQTATVADIYLTRGAPSQAVLSSRIGQLAIIPLSNPTVFSPGGTFTAQVQFDEAVLAGARVTYFVPGGSREEGVTGTTLNADENGEVVVTCETAGAHLLMIRHLAYAPEGAETDVRSHTTTLTLLCH